MTERSPAGPERPSRLERIARAIASVTRYWCVPGYMPGFIPSQFSRLPEPKNGMCEQATSKPLQPPNPEFGLTQRYVAQQIALMEEQFR